MKDSSYIWISECKDQPRMNNMCVAMPTKYNNNIPIVSNLIGDNEISSLSSQIAQHISFKLKQQIFLSCSIMNQPSVIAYIEKEILKRFE